MKLKIKKLKTALRQNALYLGAALLLAPAACANDDGASEVASRPNSEEVIYFVLPDRFANGDPSNDRGGMDGSRLQHGFDPTHKGFFQGGDLRGLTQKLDYIQDLGATAVWLTPIYKNKAVQGGPGYESAGYHGYWITDFTTLDPHLGTEEDLKAFVDAAHARGMKVIMDIVTNHTADVIQFRECHDPAFAGEKVDPSCPYRSKADYPYTTLGGPAGPAINDGFMSDAAPFQTEENFAKLSNPNYAYTPFVPAGEEAIKTPAWLNDVTLYHNRGNTTFRGENSLYGDFVGLDDLFTENPKVVNGFIEIYKDWISKYKIDGFRIDTAKHVNPEFWRQFLPAILEHAEAEGLPNFYIFGEISYDTPEPELLAKATVTDGFPGALDFGFFRTVEAVLANNEPTEMLADLFAADAVYADGFETARQLPTFVGNHDFGRFAMLARKANPDLSTEDLYKRSLLAHALMIYGRGVPVIYYGDEQGFVGDGNDQGAREPMFSSQTASYNDNEAIGSSLNPAADNFDTSQPVFKALKSMIADRRRLTVLRDGAMVTRFATHESGGLYAFSRTDGEEEVLVALNTGGAPISVNIETDARASTWQSLQGRCPDMASARATLSLELPAYGFAVCHASWK